MMVAAAFTALVTITSGFTQKTYVDYSNCGCPELSSRPLAYASDYVDGNKNLINDNTVWVCDSIYILDTKVYVDSLQTITIQAGTVIKGVYSETDANALIVCRGAKIYAIGSEKCPIVFTAEDDPLDGTYSVCNNQKWGGVIILGMAYNNVLSTDQHSGGDPIGIYNGTGTIEGLYHPDSRHHYGVNLDGGQSFDDNDNSGILEYVSIRHGGAEIGDANEINGLTLGSVGRGTRLRHIEVISNYDDGIEFFGGTADLKYASIMFCKDDYFDWDQGYKGRGQFLYGVQLPEFGGQGDQGDNGMEMDGDDGYDASRPANSDPTFFNVTLIGSGASGDKGFEAKERTLGEVSNSLICRFDKGANGENILYDGSDFEIFNNSFQNCNTVLNGTITDPKFTNDGNLILTTSVIDDSLSLDCNSNNVVHNGLDPVPAAGTVNTDYLPPVDDFFTPAAYRGAFAPGLKPWTDEWTLHEGLGTDNSCWDCPEDINGDGDINITDFLQFLGQFGNSCGN